MRRASSREKHSFIQFYFDDWKAGTAHMTRLVRSIYFDICLYTWDKRRPVTRGALTIMLADVENGPEIVNALVEEGTLSADAHGNIHSPRALREAERAFEAWEQKSRAGKKARKSEEVEEPIEQRSISDATVLNHCSRDSDSDSEPDTDTEESSDDDSARDLALSRSAGRSSVVDQWNETARTCGLKQIATMTSERTAKLDQRLDEYGVDAIIQGIKMIPDNAFLLGRGENGWKATFDWLVRPDTVCWLIEEQYEPRKGQTSGPPPIPPAPKTQAEADLSNATLGEYGSILRWRLEDGKFQLLPPPLQPKHREP